jgi:hypothetical protein
MTGDQCRRLAAEVAEYHGGVVSRALLRQIGVLRHHVHKEVDRERWRLHGRQTVAVHRRELTREERWWRAIWETGADAALDGVTALIAAGLRGYEEELVHVSALRSFRAKDMSGIRVHVLNQRVDGELFGAGVPRVRPAVAAVRAAHWAASDRQAALILAMTVQQRLATGRHLMDASAQIRGRRRRGFVRGVIRDVADGAHFLSEIDFARLCRAKGLPEPVRQEIVKDEKGRIYLDVRWECGLVVEIDGAGHRWGLQVSLDNLRQNGLVIAGDRVLRIDALGLRLFTDEFMAQVRQGLIVLGGYSAHR